MLVFKPSSRETVFHILSSSLYYAKVGVGAFPQKKPSVMLPQSIGISGLDEA